MSFMKTANFKSPTTTIIEKYPSSKFKNNKVTFGSSLPMIKGTIQDETRNEQLRSSIPRNANRSVERSPDTNDLNTPAKKLYNFIVAEVKKFVATKRVSEQGIMELD